MNRCIHKDTRFHQKRIGRTSSGVNVDAETHAMPIDDQYNRRPTFPGVLLPDVLPCMQANAVRFADAKFVGMHVFLPSVAALRGTASQFDPLKSPLCPVCRTERYRDGIFQVCVCISRCREYCIAEGLWR